MTKIYVYAEEVGTWGNLHFVGFAITNTGKWIAGAVSRVDEDTVIARVTNMAIMKARIMLSDTDVEVIRSMPDSPEVLAAQEIAFERMP